ncbi:MAG: hypothetical protein R2741_09790 [Methanolobus sp.]
MIAIQDVRLLLDKIADPPTYDSVGDLITYTYNVTNTGNVVIPGDINVTDDVIGLITISSSSLAPGESVTGTGTYSITQSDLDNGNVTNVAYATAVFGDKEVRSNEDTETVIAIQDTELLLDKTATPETYDSVGDVITYTYKVTNNGNIVITGDITVVDDMIGSIIIPSTTLSPGESVTGTGTYTITQFDLDNRKVTNVAYATAVYDGDEVISNIDTETVNAVQDASICLKKIASPETYDSVGDIITYTYKVVNTGNVAINGDITVVDDMIGTITISSTTLNPGQLVTGKATYTITQSDIENCEVTNIAYAIASYNGDKVVSNKDCETVTAIQDARICFCKYASPETYDSVGDIITYTYKVINKGNVVIYGDITVVDDVLGTIKIPSSTLNPGESVIGTATYSITQSDLDNCEVTNVAYATASYNDGTIKSNKDCVTITAVKEASISIDKTADTTTFSYPGQVIEYKIVVTNTGDVELSEVTVVDEMLGELSCSSTDNGVALAGDSLTLACCPDQNFHRFPGARCESVVCTGYYTVTQEDVDNGCIVNGMCDRLL